MFSYSFICLFIYSRSLLIVITIFTLGVRPSVPTFKNLAKQNKFQVRILIAIGGTVGLADWIIDGTHVL